MVCARARKRDIALASEPVQLAALMNYTEKVLVLLCTFISSHNGFHWTQYKYTLNMVLGMFPTFGELIRYSITGCLISTPVPPFSKQKNIFFGYFDPENMFLDNKNR